MAKPRQDKGGWYPLSVLGGLQGMEPGAWTPWVQTRHREAGRPDSHGSRPIPMCSLTRSLQQTHRHLVYQSGRLMTMGHCQAHSPEWRSNRPILMPMP